MILKALVVDDSRSSRMLMVKILSEKLGLEVEEAFDGRDAIIRLIKADFTHQILFLDWVMPVIDGLECFHLIRKLWPIEQKLLAIMVTSKSRKEDIIEALRSGIDDYIVKPFNTDIVAKKIEHLLVKKGFIAAPPHEIPNMANLSRQNVHRSNQTTSLAPNPRHPSQTLSPPTNSSDRWQDESAKPSTNDPEKVIDDWDRFDKDR